MSTEHVHIDELSDGELFTEWMEFFGFSRGCQMLGWCVAWGMQGRADNLAEYRKELAGKDDCSERSVYRALLDLKRFKDHLKAKQLVKYVETEELAARMGQLRPELT